MNKSMACVVAVLTTLGTSLSVQAAPGPRWNVTATGKIDYGSDTSGIFGTANANLSGLTYSQTITASVDPSQWSASGNSSYQSAVDGSGPEFTDTVTVSGHSITYTATTISGDQYISDGASQYAHGSYDEIFSVQEGNTSSGETLYAYAYADSYDTRFVPGVSFAQTISQTLNGSFETYSLFSLSSRDGTITYFEGTPSSIAINISAVPESGVPTMMITGLGMLGFIRHRKARKAV